MIRKAIVLAAGKGRRLMPLTQAIPKEMIRVGLKPTIEHVISVLKAGNINQILVIVGRKKESIIDHLGSGERLGVDILYKVQEKAKGTADAVSLGKEFVKGEDFVVIYGDNYFKPYETMKEILEFHRTRNADTTIVLHIVENPERFGIVKMDDENKILDVFEKPSLEESKKYMFHDMHLGIAGLLVLNDKIFNYIEQTVIGEDSETWLTDSIKLMLKDEHKILGYLFKGTRYDVGTYESLLKADKYETDLK